MKDEKQVTMKNGQNALSGICTVCGTKMFKMGGGGGRKIAKATATRASKQGKKGNARAKIKARAKGKRK
jgi:hypothetical protein